MFREAVLPVMRRLHCYNSRQVWNMTLRAKQTDRYFTRGTGCRRKKKQLCVPGHVLRMSSSTGEGPPGDKDPKTGEAPAKDKDTKDKDTKDEKATKEKDAKGTKDKDKDMEHKEGPKKESEISHQQAVGDRKKYQLLMDSELRQSKHDSLEPAVMFGEYRDEDGLYDVSRFLDALRSCGLRRTDERLNDLRFGLWNLHKSSGSSEITPETMRLDRDTFVRIITPNLKIISQAFRQQLVIPNFPAFVKEIEEIYFACQRNTGGEVASYIPQLARSSPDIWGVSVCTIDGQRYSIGDVVSPFTIQSATKPITYALALDRLGRSQVHSYVGKEPSGRGFNELVLNPEGMPHNPMVNSGAIIVCSLILELFEPKMSRRDRLEYLQQFFKRMAGREYIGFNQTVYQSERNAANRNFALGYYMKENSKSKKDCFPEGANFHECMNFYFQSCSLEANCESLSVIGATLANGGVCPTNQERIIQPSAVRDVLSLMHSCGMYDYSGAFAFEVGLPAKSGVSGNLLLVIPNTMGVCVYSPPLDSLGNSTRGVQFSKELVQKFNFHRYDNLKHLSAKRDPRRHHLETEGLGIVNLLFSAAAGDLANIRRHWLSGLDMDIADYDGRTALHLAACEGHLDCVVFLLRHCRVSLNSKDRWGNRAIDEAAQFKKYQVVDFMKSWESEMRKEKLLGKERKEEKKKEEGTEDGDDNPFQAY